MDGIERIKMKPEFLKKNNLIDKLFKKTTYYNNSNASNQKSVTRIDHVPKLLCKY